MSSERISRELKTMQDWSKDKFVNSLKYNEEKISISKLLDNASKTSLPPNEGMEDFYDKNKIEMTKLIWSYLGTKSLIGIRSVFEDENKRYYIKNHLLPGDPVKELIGSIPLNIKRHKLKASLPSMIAMKDLKVVCNLDPIEELKQITAMEVALELDRKILKKIREEAATRSCWDFQNALGDTIMEKYEALYVHLMQMNKCISDRTHTDGANFIVTSPEVASIFESATAGFDKDPFTCNLGIYSAGIINKRWKIYKDPLHKPNQLIMGYAGNIAARRGLFFSPKNLFEISGRKKFTDWDCDNRWELSCDYDLEFIPDGQVYYAVVDIANFVI